MVLPETETDAEGDIEALGDEVPDTLKLPDAVRDGDAVLLKVCEAVMLPVAVAEALDVRDNDPLADEE